MVAERHLAWCAAFAESLEDATYTSNEAEAYELVDRDIDNLRAAMTWALQHRHPHGLRIRGRARRVLGL